jgi:hypothetical protein
VRRYPTLFLQDAVFVSEVVNDVELVAVPTTKPIWSPMSAFRGAIWTPDVPRFVVLIGRHTDVGAHVVPARVQKEAMK